MRVAGPQNTIPTCRRTTTFAENLKVHQHQYRRNHLDSIQTYRSCLLSLFCCSRRECGNSMFSPGWAEARLAGDVAPRASVLRRSYWYTSSKESDGSCPSIWSVSISGEPQFPPLFHLLKHEAGQTCSTDLAPKKRRRGNPLRDWHCNGTGACASVTVTLSNSSQGRHGSIVSS